VCEKYWPSSIGEQKTVSITQSTEEAFTIAIKLLEEKELSEYLVQRLMQYTKQDGSKSYVLQIQYLESWKDHAYGHAIP